MMEGDLVSQFMEVTACESQAAAVRQLASCQWNLEKAVNLFFAAGGVVAGPSIAAPPPPPPPPPPVEEKEEEEEGVRAPIPTFVERICDDAYYDSISRRADLAARSMWAERPPKPVPSVPMQGISPAEPVGNAAVSDAEEEKSNGRQEKDYDDDVQDEDDLSGVEGYGMAGSDDDVEDQAGDENKEDEEAAEQKNASDDDDDDSYMEDYGFEMEEDDGYHDALMEEDEEQVPRPSQRPGSLAQMYRLPYDLMFPGPFHFAKVHAATQDRFLLVNLQAQDFLSCLHNRDLWTNEVVKQAVTDNFVFFLLTKLNDYGDEGTKVCTFYKIQDDQLPALLVLDPITGQMLSRMSGAIDPDEFMLFIEKYSSSKPTEMSRPKIVPKIEAVAQGSDDSEAAGTAGGEQEQEGSASSPGAAGEEKEEEPVPMVEEEAPAEMVDDSGDDEPEEGEKMCKLRVRFPDGSVVPKEFGCKRRVSKLFAFCRSAVRDAGKTDEQVTFRIMRLVGRAFEELQKDGATFEELSLNFATVSVVFVT
ncbi:hypothetical protein PR202_gb09194 [Eleusine coracana subsp. coracana]|uniref:UBX domain-containing protein n=1 Tax=Eleusine coracana subsp. coracana TaxID=191504 RepID=A0AAV5EHN5_ELECO|nr:hypothetical protein PR202_gb09194 [Eleusine coracana subsp. coracana]